MAELFSINETKLSMSAIVFSLSGGFSIFIMVSMAVHREASISLAALLITSIVERPIPLLGVLIMRSRFTSSLWFAMTRR